MTLLGVFTCSFVDLSNVLLPRQRTLSQTIDVGLVVHDVIPKIKFVHAYLKYVTCDELISGLEILRMYDQYPLGWFGITYASRALAC